MVSRCFVLSSIALSATIASRQVPAPARAPPIELAIGPSTHSRLSPGDAQIGALGRCARFRLCATEDGECTASAESFEFDVRLLVKEIAAKSADDFVLEGWTIENLDRGRGDGERLSFPTRKGCTYGVVVAGTFDAVGEFDLSITRGAPPATTDADDAAADLDFFQAALAQASERQAWARAARVGWQAAESAIRLQQAEATDRLLASARSALDHAVTLCADEVELDRARLGWIDGLLAETRGEWKAAVGHFASAERRCDPAARHLGDEWRVGFEKASQCALAGLLEASLACDDVTTALAAARKLAKATPAPAADAAPTLIECVLLVLLDRAGEGDEASRRAPDCAARLERAANPPPEVVIEFGRFLLGRARHAEAIGRLRVALGQAESAGNDAAIVNLAGELAGALYELGHFAEAQAISWRMLVAARAIGAPLSQADALFGLATTKFERSLFAPARADAEASRKLFVGENATGRVADTCFLLARIAGAEGDFDAAGRWLADAEKGTVEAGAAARAIEIRIERGKQLEERARATGATTSDAAADLFRNALQDADALRDRRLVARARVDLGDLARVKGDHDEACRLSRQAIDELRTLCRFDELQYPLLTIGDSALRVNDAALARAALDEAEESLRHPTVPGMVGDGAALRRAQLSEWGEIAQDLTTLELAAKTDDAQRTRVIEEGWRAAGRWKTRVLLSGIDEHARRREAGASELANELHSKMALQDRLSSELADAWKAGDAAASIDRRRTGLRDVVAQVRALEAKLFAAAPPRAEGEVPTLAELRKAVIGPETLLVELANGRDHLYAYAIDADSIRRFDLGPRKPIESSADDYSRLLSDTRQLPTPAAVAKSGGELYTRLLRPLLDGTPPGRRRLFVAPTTALGATPFDALVMRADPATGRQPRFRELHYVIDEWVVSLLPSGAVACELARQQPRRERGTMLLVGAPRPAADARDETLAASPAEAARGATPERDPFMRKELLDIAFQLATGDESKRLGALKQKPDGSLKAGVFELHLGEAATKEVLRGSLARFAVLHFACHGQWNAHDPRDTALELAPSNGDTGRLSVLDVLDLELDANVTVLATCSSARGVRIDGDCEQSLARAFLAAGSRSVIATLWDVDDEKTCALMGQFFVGEPSTPAAEVDLARQLALAKSTLKHRGVRGGDHVSPIGGGGSDEELDDVAPPLWAGIVFFGTGPRK